MVAEAWEKRKFGAQDTFWKLKSIFNLKQNHSMNQKMGLKLTMPISNFKAGIFSMPTSFFDVNYPLRINLTSVVRKRKLGTQGNILKNRIPLSTIISRLGAPQSVDRFSSLQVFLVDRCPVPSDLQPGGRPSPKKKCATEPDRTYFRKYFKSMAKNWLLILDFDLSPKKFMGSFKISLNNNNNFLLLENLLFS